MAKIIFNKTMDLEIGFVIIYFEFNTNCNVLPRLWISQTILKVGQLHKISRDLCHFAKLDFASKEIGFVVFLCFKLEIMT